MGLGSGIRNQEKTYSGSAILKKVYTCQTKNSCGTLVPTLEPYSTPPPPSLTLFRVRKKSHLWRACVSGALGWACSRGPVTAQPGAEMWNETQ